MIKHSPEVYGANVFPEGLVDSVCPQRLGAISLGGLLVDDRFSAQQQHIHTKLGEGPDLSEFDISCTPLQSSEGQEPCEPSFLDFIDPLTVATRHLFNEVPKGYGLSQEGRLLSPDDLRNISKAGRAGALNNALYVNMQVSNMRRNISEEIRSH